MIHPLRFAVVFLILFSFASSTCSAQQTVDLKCDYRKNPLAIDRSQPLLSWRLRGERNELSQTAYRIQASRSGDNFDAGSLWDSGWVNDARSVAIEYSGKLPAAGQRVFWRVKIRDETGTDLPWSKLAWFDVGLPEDGDWQGAQWISCTRKFKPEYGPDDVMGDWIAASDESGDSKSIEFRFKFLLPDKPVVYAGTWWSQVDTGEIELDFNGYKGLNGTEGPPSIFHKDFSFYTRRENEITITLTGADLSTPISVGVKIIFADQSQQIVQTGPNWKVQVGQNGNPKSALLVGSYGEQPFGQAKVSSRAPLAAAWYKRDFDITKSIASARLYLCGLGYSEPYLNGEKIGDHVLDPGQTDYQHFAHYQVFDVKSQLKSGSNSLAILLGDGWYNNDRMFSHARFAYGKPGLRSYLDVRYGDGTRDKIVSDQKWYWKESAVTMSSLFMGDRIDYRLQDDQWQTKGFSQAWKPVKKIKAISKKLIAQDFPPIRIVREIEPVKIWQTGDKTWIVDLGENISGWVGLDFDEPAGTEIRLRCVEMLDEDQTQLANVPESFWSCHGTPQSHQIIADGKPHRWRPYFSYHGFRFAEIHGLGKPPTREQVRGLVVHTDTPVVATFESSNPLLNRIFKMGIQTHLNNMHSILEDCPHREKCLWGGDLHSSWATGFFALESATFYRQQVRLFYTPPFDRLGIPGRIGVGRRSTNKTLDFTWSVSPLFLAWQNYQLNADLQTAEQHYDAMLFFLRYFAENSPDLLPTIHRYGDHAAPIGIPRTPADSGLIAALNFQAAAARFADLADAIGKSNDATWSRELADKIRESIVRNFYDSKNHTFGNGTHDSLALAFSIVSPSESKALAVSLAKYYQDNGKKFDGGFMSYHIYPQLAENGFVDLALEMLLNPDYPGIAQSIRDHDATTIFERFRMDSRRSQLRQSLDHHAMNHPTAWMLNYLAGIRCQANSPGFQRILLSPVIPTALSSVRATVRTAYGKIKSSWKQQGEQIIWSVSIPPNCVAQTRLPEAINNIYLNGKAIQKSKQLELKSGEYELRWSRGVKPPLGFEKVFNGVDLKGWQGGDEWSVENGALTGVADGSLKANRFVVWQGKPLKNFDLRVKVRVTEEGNSGIQYRGTVRPDLGPYRVSGYQCDIVDKVPEYNGMLYEEMGRRILARQGKSVIVDTAGHPWITHANPARRFQPNQWHTYRVLAQGNHLQHWIDGEKTADVIDLNESGRSLEGVLAVQVHVGPPMKIQYKDFFLKRLPDDLPLLLSHETHIPGEAVQVKPQGRLPKNWKPVTYAQRAKLND